MHVDALIAPAAKVAGWLGQACFFSRFFVQWIQSERARRSVVPRSFWQLSLAGAILVSAYALWKDTPLLLVGYVISAVVAVRNLSLGSGRARVDGRIAAGVAIVLFALSIVVELVAGKVAEPGGSVAWLVVGIVGQTLWSSRFPVQWWLSERAGESHFPRAFWWISLAGNLLLLAYSLHLRDPVFVLGFVPGPLLQVRNLWLMRVGHARHVEPSAGSPATAEEAC